MNYFAKQNSSDEEKIVRGGILLRIFVRGVSKYFFVRQKVVDEELATRKLLFDGQNNYFEATSTNIRSSIPTRSIFDEESPQRPVILLVTVV